MSVMIDDQPLAFEKLGLKTLGQVLSHVSKDNRLVINVLIDGQTPDLGQMSEVRAVSLAGKTVFVETADPREMALEVLGELGTHLEQADEFRRETVELLAAGQHPKAMQKLGACFSVWQHVQESVVKTAQLLRIDLNELECDGRALGDMVGEFAEQLKEIKRALEGRDFVSLSDVLAYEMTETSQRWTAGIDALRGAIDQD